MKFVRLFTLMSFPLLTFVSCVHQEQAPTQRPVFPTPSMALSHAQRETALASPPKQGEEQTTEKPEKDTLGKQTAESPQKDTLGKQTAGKADETNKQSTKPVPKPVTTLLVPAHLQEILSSLPMGIIGGTEQVYLENISVPLKAKVDTGADTCSLHAQQIKYFERDGKAWVSFQIIDPSLPKPYLFERRIKRRPKIKRHGAESIRRPVIEMKIRMGKHMIKCDFSLTDRSRFEFPVLIGQNLLNGRAAVDVSRNNLLSK